jgi:2-deoxy-D-gluconate 3-dehydrogenase
MTSATTPASYTESLFGLEGQLAVVTGASRGIGLATTAALASAGADIIAVSQSMPEGDSDARTLVQALGRKFTPLRADFSVREQVIELAEDLAGRGVDILVNNAGAIRRAPAAEHSDEDFDYVLDVNLRSTFILSREVGRSMVRRGHGKIVNLASLLSFQGGMTVPAYAASKGAVAQLTKALCNEWAGRGVNVNAIAPGYMNTEMNAALLADPVRLEQLSTRIPAGRWGQPQDIGDVVVFLASRAAAYVHGQVIAVDGGWMAR